MRTLLAALIGLSTVGCLNTQVLHVSDEAHPARPNETVEILVERPAAPHRVLAVVESRKQSILHCQTDMLKAVVSEAARLGGDAILLGIRQPGSETLVTGLAAIKSHRRDLAGEVIVYDREDWIAGGREAAGKIE
jgi:hypothetical protein